MGVDRLWRRCFGILVVFRIILGPCHGVGRRRFGDDELPDGRAQDVKTIILALVFSLATVACLPSRDRLVVLDGFKVQHTTCGGTTFVWVEYESCGARSVLAGHPDCHGAASEPEVIK